jgi:hypothetical protein
MEEDSRNQARRKPALEQCAPVALTSGPEPHPGGPKAFVIRAHFPSLKTAFVPFFIPRSRYI